MTAVKGSKQYQLEVVPYRPLLRWGSRLALSLAIAAGVAASYQYGLFKGTELQRQAIAERDLLREQLQTARKDAADYRQQVANLQLGAEVDRQANEDVRGEVIELKDQIAALNEEISFYKGLMSPSGNKRGLTIGSFSIVATDSPRRYAYKLVLQQLATNHQLLSGYLNFNVVGRENGVLVTKPLRELSDSVSYDNIKLRFKYFQNFNGELLLPEGFEPVRIELKARSTGKNAAVVEEKFGWLVKNPRSEPSAQISTTVQQSAVAPALQQ